VVDAEFWNPDLPGILEPAEVGASGDAIWIICERRDNSAAIACDCDDRALMIGVERVAVGEAAAFIPDQRLVNAGPVDVASEKSAAGAIVFRNECIAVVEKPSRPAVASHLIKPPERIVFENCVLRTRSADEPVLDVIAVGDSTIRDQIAVLVV
jgi:hypothetical protein